MQRLPTALGFNMVKDVKSTGQPYGVGMTQDDMMNKDQCILLDNNDVMIGHSSKVASHQFNQDTPRGLLHRAFSVFLFNEKGELLLQQRAGDKITFPNVWTNTCCSHPLHGYSPSEVDSAENVANGNVSGVISAAIRKLEHELGIPVTAISPNKFKYLTRLHYWAADVVTHGTQSPWGEHEIDYILFVQCNVALKPNAEEVGGTKYVTQDQLKQMMAPSSGMLWSPWFRIIAEQFLPYWWSDLNATLTTNEWVDYKTIHRFDPTSEHMGGAGNAGALLGAAKNPFAGRANLKTGDVSLKQGAYGKVKIHAHSKLEQLMHFDEILAGVWFKLEGMPNKVDNSKEDVKFCDDMLGKVSRSFAAVIRQLPRGLCLDIMIFYLALRALDTIEDDMEAFKGDKNGGEKEKLRLLNNFYQEGLVTPGWTMDGVGEGDEMVLLQEYYRCVTVFKGLSPGSQEVIADITKRMGQGMAAFVGKDLGQGTVKVVDYDLYCHYVAGLVGEGLSRLFTVTGYEKPEVALVATTKANTMGLFLQKTNIIRDYLEDYVDGRAFWPQEIWKLYAKSGDLGELAKPEARTQAVECLNHLVTNALTCIPECLEYMKMLRTEEVFRFCAIPQVMAIATLAELYNNPKVFTGVVKIRKFQAAQLILDTKSEDGLHKWFNVLTRNIRKRIPAGDPSAEDTLSICNEVIRLTDARASTAKNYGYAQATNVVAASVFAVSAYVVFAADGKAGQFIKMVSGGNASYNGLKSLALQAGSKWVSALGTSLAFMFGYGVAASARESLIKADP